MEKAYQINMVFFVEKGKSYLCHKLPMQFNGPELFDTLIMVKKTNQKIRGIKNVAHRIKGLGGSYHSRHNRCCRICRLFLI
jgi:hypothetical protein